MIETPVRTVVVVVKTHKVSAHLFFRWQLNAESLLGNRDLCRRMPSCEVKDYIASVGRCVGVHGKDDAAMVVGIAFLGIQCAEYGLPVVGITYRPVLVGSECDMRVATLGIDGEKIRIEHYSVRLGSGRYVLAIA